jgi:hypothetical protein
MKNCNCLIRISLTSCVLKEIHRFRGEKQGNSRFIKYLYRKVKFLLRRKRLTTVAGLKDYNQTLISSSKI